MEIAIGVDIEENSRFDGKSLGNDEKFLKKIFTEGELRYCFKSKNSSEHLCARYCAKEAVVKALYDLKIKDIYYSDIEILKNKDNVPYVVLKQYPNLKIKISMSHSKNYSTANAMIIKE